VVYGIIQQHGGSIRVEEADGGGALFIISLPIESPENPKDDMEN
jgi:signal transduction histidine kinase